MSDFLPGDSNSAILEIGLAQGFCQRVDCRDIENTLVQQAARGDHNAFAALYEMHVDRVFRHVRYQVTDASDAEDITQNVFIKAWKSVPNYKSTGAPFVTWLIVIARNAIIDHYRSRKHIHHLDDDCDLKGGPDPVATVESDFGNAEIREALMRFIDGFSYEEIGRALGKSGGTVRVIQHRALKELKDMLEEREIGIRTR
jgi:RNA polymerase sigma-70 factor (ECF subfamily)